MARNNSRTAIAATKANARPVFVRTDDRRRMGDPAPSVTHNPSVADNEGALQT
jgi:hypothetical protein